MHQQSSEAAGTPSPGWGAGGRRGHSPWTATRHRKKNRPCDSHRDVDEQEVTTSDQEADFAIVSRPCLGVRKESVDGASTLPDHSTAMEGLTSQLFGACLKPQFDSTSSASMLDYPASSASTEAHVLMTERSSVGGSWPLTGPFWLTEPPISPPERSTQRQSWAGLPDHPSTTEVFASPAASSACVAPPATPLTPLHPSHTCRTSAFDVGGLADDMHHRTYHFGVVASLPAVVQCLLQPQGVFAGAVDVEHVLGNEASGSDPSAANPTPSSGTACSLGVRMALDPVALAPPRPIPILHKSTSRRDSHRPSVHFDVEAGSPVHGSHGNDCTSLQPADGTTTPLRPGSAGASDSDSDGDMTTPARGGACGGHALAHTTPALLARIPQPMFDEFMAHVDNDSGSDSAKEDGPGGFRLFSSLHHTANTAIKHEPPHASSRASQGHCADGGLGEELDGCGQGSLDTDYEASDEFCTPQRFSSQTGGGTLGRFDLYSAGSTGVQPRAPFSAWLTNCGAYEASGGGPPLPLDQLTTLDEYNTQLHKAAAVGDRGRADRLWAALCERGLNPDLRTLNCLMRCVSRSHADPDDAEQLAREVCKAGDLSPNATTYNLLAETRVRFEQLCGGR